MQGTLHFGEDLAERTNYKKIVVESMLQHYGVRTYCHDFVDNHWTALWFSLYELKKEREKGQSKKTNYYEKDFHARQVATLNSGGPQRYMLADENAWNLFEKFLAEEEP